MGVKMVISFGMSLELNLSAGIEGPGYYIYMYSTVWQANVIKYILQCVKIRNAKRVSSLRVSTQGSREILVSILQRRGAFQVIIRFFQRGCPLLPFKFFDMKAKNPHQTHRLYVMKAGWTFSAYNTATNIPLLCVMALIFWLATSHQTLTPS